MSKKNVTGQKAEKLARQYLANRGYRIRETNWYYFHKEIDIIAEKDGRLVIVEVKSTIESNYTNASDLMSSRKMHFLVDAAEAYIFKYNIEMEVRFDLIAVVFSRGGGVLTEHIEQAFIPGVNW